LVSTHNVSSLVVCLCEQTGVVMYQAHTCAESLASKSKDGIHYYVFRIEDFIFRPDDNVPEPLAQLVTNLGSQECST